MRLFLLFLLLLTAPLHGITALTNGDTVKTDGEFSYPALRAGNAYAFSLSGGFGSGTATVGYINPAGTFTSLGRSFTAAGSVTCILPESATAGQGIPAVSLTGSTSPTMLLTITQADAGQVDVTNAAVTAAIAEDPAAVRDAIQAVYSGVDLLERFDLNSRWTAGGTITHNVTMPEIGTSPWRLAVTGSSIVAPAVVAGTNGNGWMPVGDERLAYLGNSVPSLNGKFNLGFIFELLADSRDGFNNIMNISFSKNEMITSGGGIVPTGVVHINFSMFGVQGIGFYGGSAIACKNATFDGAQYPWNGTGAGLAHNRKYALVLKVDGDELTITIPGVGSLIFSDPAISDIVGETFTNFWWEPTSPLYSGSQYGQVPKLYQVFSGESKMLMADAGGYGGNPSINGWLRHDLPGKLNLFYRGAAAVSTNGSLPNNLRMAIGASALQSIGGKSRAKGVVFSDSGLYSGNVDCIDVGAQATAYAPMNTDPNLTTQLASSAGAETTLKSIGAITGMNAGDSEELTYYGSLVGGNAKKIKVRIGVVNVDLFDSKTTLDALSGPYILKVYRGTSSASSHVVFSSLSVNGQAPMIQRVSTNLGYVYYPFELRTTTVDAGGITVDHMMRVVNHVKNP